MSNEAWYVRDRNKVSGPFNREQLDALRRRGQLARFHQISQDRQTWAPASTLTDLFAPPPSSTTIERAPAPGPAATEPAEHWYYQDGQSASGPISALALLGLFAAGTVSPETLVWKEGAPDWVPLRDAGLRPSTTGPGSNSAVHAPARLSNSTKAPTRKRWSAGDVWLALGIGAGVGGVVLVLGFLLLFRMGGLGLGTGARGASGGSWLGGSPTIQSVNDASGLSGAVGLVICGWSVVEFDGTRTECCLSTGTCFAVSDKGLLVTNRHVIDDISRFLNAEKLRREIELKTRMKVDPKIWVFFKNKKYPATIRYESDEYDLAILKIEPGRPMPYFRLAAAEEVARGTPVFALGFPGASRMPLSGEEAIDKFAREKKKGVKIDYHFQRSNFDYVVTNGIVSVVRREGRTVKLEHTARISGGNSGGPLVTTDGTVIGINTLIAKENETSPPTYVALAVAQLRDEIAQNVPELSPP